MCHYLAAAEPSLAIPILKIKKHFGRVLDPRLHALEKGHCFPAIDKPVVVRECEVHHGSGLDLAVDHHGPHLGGVHAQDCRLRGVDDGRTKERTEDATVRDGERS